MNDFKLLLFGLKCTFFGLVGTCLWFLEFPFRLVYALVVTTFLLIRGVFK